MRLSDLPGNPPSFEAEAGYVMAWTPDGARDGLDLGCGYRKAADWLIGVDHHSGEWTDTSGAKHTAAPDVVSDLRTLPFDDVSMDLVVSIHSLEHFNEPGLILREWARVLRIGGRMAIVVPDWRHTFSCTNPDQIADPEAHKWDYTLDELCRQVLNVPGLNLLDAREVNHNWSVGVALERIA
jgi:SAM-dependent methyltransferase